MDIGGPGRLSETIEDIEEGDSLSLTESIENKDLLLCLGLTSGTDPLYIQHDYAQKTKYEKPIIPSVILMGIITSTISKHLPGPSSHVVSFSVNFVEPVLHCGTLTFQLEVVRVDKMKDVITISTEAVNEQENYALDAVVMVQPPQVTIDKLTEREGTLAYE